MIDLDEFLTAAEIVGPLVDVLPEQGRRRMQVENRAPRAEVPTTLRRGIWSRDGGVCWVCGMQAAYGVIDHVRPRSAWPKDELGLADRSDNLRLACWRCNEDKSNFLYLGGDSPLGITTSCHRCAGEPGPGVRCYCLRCGMGGLCDSERLFLGMQAA